MFPLHFSGGFCLQHSFKIYFGADYVYSDIKYKNNTLYEMDDGYNGISPVIGFSSYGVGLEAWYMFSDKAENKHGYESELTAYGADLVGEAPLSESFSVIVSIGWPNIPLKSLSPTVGNMTRTLTARDSVSACNMKLFRTSL